MTWYLIFNGIMYQIYFHSYCVLYIYIPIKIGYRFVFESKI